MTVFLCINQNTYKMFNMQVIKMDVLRYFSKLSFIKVIIKPDAL